MYRTVAVSAAVLTLLLASTGLGQEAKLTASYEDFQEWGK